MRALNTEFELFGATCVPAGVRAAGVCGRVGDCLAGGDPEAREKTQNNGNEAKKSLKTSDIAFLNAANYARLTRKLAQIRA
jgi:hypothetical protein